MFEGLKITTEFHKEDIHEEGGKEVLKDGDKWYLVAGALVLASITYHKYINFSMFTVHCTEFSIDRTANPYPHELRDKNTLEEAKEAIRARLKVSD